jgi:formiminotetrahydrofolate cyclodeaminase
VAAAAAVARAALESAIVNIDINRQQIRDDAESTRLGQVIKELEPALATADRIATAVREKLQS